jgi:hypothetical protein
MTVLIEASRDGDHIATTTVVLRDNLTAVSVPIGSRP